MKNRWKQLVAVVLVMALSVGIMPMSVYAEEENNSPAEETTNQLKVSPKYETLKLYKGMVYAPIMTWEQDEKLPQYGTVADLKNAVFSSSDQKVASIDKKGIVTAKKAGSASIQVTSDEWSGTIKINVLPIKKINKKKLVKTVKVKDPQLSGLVTSYSKKDKEVKKGYVKAGRKYSLKGHSVSIYKQPDNSKRYMLNYTVCDKKGNPIKNVKNVEVPYEQYLVFFRICNDLDFSCDIIKSLCTHKKFEMHYEYPTAEKKYLRNPTSKSIDDLMWEYGWRNTCG